MSQTIATSTVPNGPFDFPEISAERIRKVCETPGLMKEPKGRALLVEVLNFAAQAEQRIAEQDARIHQLESLTMTDELTGLLNRRGFVFGLKRTLQSARRHNEEGLLIFVDLDNFKPVNDTHGHGTGDAVLHRTGELLVSNVRKTDLIARLGGDEFAILLVQANRNEGRKRVQIVRQILNENSVTHAGVTIPIHASVGAAPYNGSSEPETLMRKADKAMYREKNKRAAGLHVVR